VRDEDEADYTRFVEAAWPRLFRSAYALTGDYQHAEDALQSALVKTHSAWGKVRRADSPEAYVRRILTNEVLGWWRRASWGREQPSGERVDVPAASHEDALVQTDEIWRALADLPPRQRAVVVLRYFEDLSEREVAQVLGIRPGTVKSQSSAALTKLRDALVGRPVASHVGSEGETA